MAIERELKYTLQPADYKKILRAWRNHVKTKHLTNVYFDTPQLSLRRSKMGCRIRLLDGKKAELTVKLPSKGSASSVRGFRARVEHECPIPLSSARRILRGKIPLAALDAQPVRFLRSHFSDRVLERIIPLGAMKTTRSVATLARGLEMEIDKSVVFGKTFYELEVECTNPKRADQLLREKLKKAGVRCTPASLSKQARFLKEWKKQA